MGAKVEGDTPFDAAFWGKAGGNVAAIAAVLTTEEFPAGSQNGKMADRFAKVEPWANQQDLLSGTSDLNTAAAALHPLKVADVASLKTGTRDVGQACGAWQTAGRIAENPGLRPLSGRVVCGRLFAAPAPGGFHIPRTPCGVFLPE